MATGNGLWQECASAFAAGELSAAWELVRGYIRQQPRDTAAHRLAGDIAAARRQWRQALIAYRKALHITPDDAAVILPLAAAELEVGMAGSAYRRLLDCRPQPGTTVRFGTEEHDAPAWCEELLAAARARLQGERRLLDRVLWHADQYRAVHRFDRSIRCYEAYLQFCPESYPAHYGLGEALSACHRDREALTCYAQAAACAPADEVAPRKQLGFAYIRLGDRERAAEVWQGLIAQHPAERFVAHYLAALQAPRPADGPQ